MSVRSIRSGRSGVDSETSHEDSSNTHSRLSSGLLPNASINQDAPRDYFRNSINSESLGMALTAPLGTLLNSTNPQLPSAEIPSRRHLHFTKEQLLAYKLYVNDIDFVNDQKNYLNNNELHLPKENKEAEYLLVVSNLIEGYSLTGQLTGVNLSSLMYYAKDDNGVKVLVRVSPNYVESVAVARFLNEWFITLGTNSPSGRRLWQAQENLGAHAIGNNSEDTDTPLANFRPLTLPPQFQGVLLPIRVLNINYSHDQLSQRRMGLVYPDNGYRTVRDYHNERALYLTCERSMAGSIRLVLSELGDDKPLHNRFIARNNLGSGVFDDLANRVMQLPKPGPVIIEILSDMIEAVSTLARCHGLGIVHNGITSHCILKATDEGDETVLTGWDFSFSIAVEDSSSSYRKSNLSDIPDLLPYMSPENTGETAAFVDYRTDFYLIGIVLYELIVGCLPFQSDNPVRLRKMHLSQRAIAPEVLGQGWISSELSAMIMRCLERNPDDRYQDARSLLIDLRQIRNAYRQDELDEGSAAFLAIDHDSDVESDPSDDTIPRFHTTSAKLTQTATRDSVLECFDNHAAGVHFISISGGTGTGKSTLLSELRGKAILKYNFIIPWTYNCTDNNVTIYASTIHGIHTITKQILASSKENIAEWRRIFISEIDTDLSILFHAIPEMKVLLGPRYKSIRSDKRKHTKSKNLSSVLNSAQDDDNDNDSIRNLELSGFDEHALNLELKFRYIIKKVFRLIGSRGLTVVLDDIHWCPLSELHLIKEITEFCGSDPLTCINVICAYRTGLPASSLDESKVLLDDVKDIFGGSSAIMSSFHLKNLPKESFASFFDYSLSTQRLTLGHSTCAAYYAATEGNILRFHYLMRIFHIKEAVSVTDDDKVERYIADGNLTTSLSETVKEYVTTAIGQEAQSILKFAAIITTNGSFKLSDLMIVTGKPLKEIHELLHECIEMRVIVPAGVYYKVPFHLIASSDFPFDLSDDVIWELTMRSRYHFGHNVIQMYFLKQLGDANDWHRYHRLCGLRYKRQMATEDTFSIKRHLVMAWHLLNACEVAMPDECETFYEALVAAGRFSLATSNLGLALTFFEASGKLIAPEDNKRRIKSMLTICQMHYYLKDYEKCIELVLKAETEFGAESRTFLYLKVRCLFYLKQFKKGMKTALKGLASLGVEASSDTHKCAQIAEKYFSQLPLSIPDIRNMKNLNHATDQEFLLIADLIMDVLSPTYILGLSSLRLALLAQLFRLINIHGVSSSCAIPLIHFANYFVQPNEDNSTLKAIEICDVALGLVNSEEGASTTLTEHIYESYVIYMAAFKHTITELVKYSDIFSFQNTSLSSVSECSLSLFVTASGFLLSFLNGNASASHLRVLHKKLASLEHDLEYILFENAIGLWLEEITFEAYRELFETVGIRSRPDLEFLYLANAVLWCASEGRYDEASSLVLERAFHVLRKLPVSILHLEFYFYSAVCLCLNKTVDNKKQGLALARRFLKLYGSWAEVCPPNFKAKHIIMLVCLKCNDPDYSSLSILDDFEEAIEAATRESRWIEVALANHLCAKWLKANSESKKRAGHYAQNALSMYSKLQADRQAEGIRKEFASIFEMFNWAGVTTIQEQKLQIPLDLTPSGSGATVSKRNTSQNLHANVKSPLDSDNFKVSSSSDLHTQSELTKVIEFCLTISESSNTESIVSSLLESVLLFSGVDYGAVVLSSDTEEPVIKAIGTLNNLYRLENESLSSRTDLVPYMMVIHCLLTGDVINKDDNPTYFESRFGKDYYYQHNICSSAACIPIKSNNVLGVIYLERHSLNREMLLGMPYFDARKIDLLSLLCSQAAVTFSKSMVYSQMELAKKSAEDATAEKASFLANMSHEIRTPFNSLFACSLFLLDTELSVIQQEYVETIKSSALVTLSIIDGILAFSKIEHGSFTLDNAPFSLNECIESAIQVSSEQVLSKNIELAYFNKTPEVDEVMGDSIRVRQIIINLVGNAVKFTLEGYVKITVHAEYITDNRYDIKLFVEDTGIGIPDKSKSKVFGAFSQVDGSSRRVKGGSGLGLAISQKLADIMNGKISFESKVGQGTTFLFSLPLEVIGKKEPTKIKPQLVAIIEQRSLGREALQAILEFYKTNVTIFESVQDLVRCSSNFDKIFVSTDFLEDYKNMKSNIKSTRSTRYLLARFGVAFADVELKELGVDSIIFTPVKRLKVEEILMDMPESPTRLTPSQGLPKNSKLADTYPLRILLAEDNVINLRVALQHLKKLGYNVEHAKDGVEVLEKCEAKLQKSDKYDVIFMDIQMPRKDGIAATVELKESFILRGFADYLPQIIALTANVAGEDRERCMNCGMLDFVSKPILPEELHRVLTKVGKQINS